MEIAIPLVALGGFYVISNQNKKKAKKETFEQRIENLNTNDMESTVLPHNLNTPDVNNFAQINLTGSDGNHAMDKYYNPSSEDYRIRQSQQQIDPKPYKNLAGETVGADYFKHNNLVPYFGSHVRERNVDDTNQQESLFDSYLGTGTQFIEKREQAPLFSPNENYNWTHGTPNRTDFIQSRMNPAMKASNVLPFQQETVGPGIGLGYTSDGLGGFNSGMLSREEWLPKTVDELRAVNNQKAGGFTLLGHEGPAKTLNPSLGSIGTVEKNRVDGSFKVEQDRWLNTTGAHKAQTFRPIEIDRTTARQDSTVDYAGVAGNGNMGEYMNGEYMESTRNQLGSVPFTAAVAVGAGGMSEGDYEAKSHVAYNNNRTANKPTDYFGAIGAALGATISPLLDAVRPTRKQNVIGSLRPYANAGTSTTNQSYLFNPADRPGTTIRETTENSKFHLNINANQNGGAYAVTDHQAVTNSRMGQSDYFYSGNSSAGSARQPRSYEAEYRQHNNDIKSSTIDGRLVPGNMSLLNNNVNITQHDRYETMPSRVPAPMMNYQSPSLDTMGSLQGKQQLYSTIQMDRNQKDILEALKGNPYALSINGQV